MRVRQSLIAVVVLVALLTAACGAGSGTADLAQEGSLPSAPEPTTDQLEVATTTVPPSTTTTLPVPPPAAAVSADFALLAPFEMPEYTTLRPGDRGPAVEKLQRRLVDLGFPLPEVHGRYESHTVAAVLGFQRVQGIVPDGIVGLATWFALAFPKPFVPPPIVVEDPAEDLPPPPQVAPEPAPAPAPGPEPPPPPPAEHPVVMHEGGPLGYIPAGSHIAMAIVYRDTQMVDLFGPHGEWLFVFPVSTGRNGSTPPGEFRVQRRSASTVSTTDHAVSMRWMVNFNGYIGFHGIPVKHGQPLWTPLGQQAVSAGCVRMADDAASLIFHHMPDGAVVIVR